MEMERRWTWERQGADLTYIFHALYSPEQAGNFRAWIIGEGDIMRALTKIVGVAVVGLGLAALPQLANAGCGKCGSDAEHTHEGDAGHSHEGEAEHKAACAHCEHGKVCTATDCTDAAHQAACTCPKSDEAATDEST